MNKKRDHIRPARRAYAEIMQEIAPYLPKTPKVKSEEPKNWKIVSNGTLPPLNSTGYS